MSSGFSGADKYVNVCLGWRVAVILLWERDRNEKNKLQELYPVGSCYFSSDFTILMVTGRSCSCLEKLASEGE